MVWDLLNLAVRTGVAVIQSLLALLPTSPLFLSSSDIAAVSGITGYVAFFLPIPAMIITFGLYIAGVLGWVAYLLLKQFIEAVIP
jgi:hypothetical protein